MKDLDDSELLTVIGGRAHAIASRRYGTNLDLMLTRLSSDIKDLARPQLHTQTMMMAMMAAMVASKNA